MADQKRRSNEPLSWDVVDRLTVHSGSGCLEWRGPVSANGVPRYWYQGRAVNVRRWVYERFNKIQPNHVVITTCDNSRCLKPQHLKALSRIDYGRLRTDDINRTFKRNQALVTRLKRILPVDYKLGNGGQDTAVLAWIYEVLWGKPHRHQDQE